MCISSMCVMVHRRIRAHRIASASAHIALWQSLWLVIGVGKWLLQNEWLWLLLQGVRDLHGSKSCSSMFALSLEVPGSYVVLASLVASSIVRCGHVQGSMLLD